MVNIKLKRLHEGVRTPKKAHSEDACYDIYAYIEDGQVEIPKETTVIIDTGFATEIPIGYFCPVYARSGLGIKQGLRPANCVGVIDSNYRGEWKVALHNDSHETRIVKNGDRIAQFAILPVPESCINEVEELETSDRGEGGFGSTGK